MTILYSKIATLAKDAKGAVLPTVAAVLVGLMGMATLALDVSRYMDLQTQLQTAADSFALAAASELDGRSTAITRANSAVTALMAGRNSSVFSAAAVTAAVTFYPALPASDATTTITGATADPTLANFVQVVVTPVTISTFIPATLFGAPSNNMTTSAVAVAGFTQTNCGKPTPIYVCNGTPGTATDFLQNPPAPAPAGMVGREVSLVANPGGGVGGNYGFLDPLGCGGNTPCLENTLAGNNVIVPNNCSATSNKLITTTGNKAAVGNYFDTRFDLYLSSAKNADPTIFTPDVNVRKGYTQANAGGGGGTCKNVVYDLNLDLTKTKALPLPDDSNIAPPYSTSVIGNGNWTTGFFTATGYWGVNFPGVATHPALTTRYALYQYEIANNLLLDQSTSNPTLSPSPPSTALLPLEEVGKPMCVPANAQANRRILYAAVIDCGSLGGGQNTVTAQGIVKFFLLQPTQPSGAPGGFGTMLAEYVDLVGTPNSASGVLHDIVQLYR